MSEPLELAGCVAVVTGAGSGIGRLSAQLFAERGAAVAVADIDSAGGEETSRTIREAGGDARFFCTDVARAADVAALVASAVESFGRLDFAHNNAGIEGPVGTIEDIDEVDFDRVLAINLKGVWLGMKYEIPELRRAGGGAIVNTSSAMGIGGLPALSPYVAAKHAVVGITRVAALECAKDNIRVNAVLPGSVRTGMMQRAIDAGHMTEQGYMDLHPMGRPATAREVAEAVLWLCSSSASFTTGHLLTVDGGMTASL